MKPLATTLAALAGLVLSGCANGPVIVHEPMTPQYTYFDGDFDYATRNGAIYTVVRGLPFDVDPDRFRAFVLQTMKGQNRGVPARFVASHSEDTDPAYKVVVAFNLHHAYGGVTLCRNPENPPIAARDDSVKMHVAFCIGDQLKTEAWGFAYGVAGPGDPKFTELIEETTLSLIPVQDGMEQGEGSPNVP